MSNSSPVGFPLEMKCNSCMQALVAIKRGELNVKRNCSCRTMMKKFSYECDLMPKTSDIFDSIVWVFDQTKGGFCFGYGNQRYYVHFSDHKDRVLYKMFWSDSII